MTLLEKAFENLEDCRYVLSLDVCALHDDSKVVVQNYYILKVFENTRQPFQTAMIQCFLSGQDIHDSVHLYGIDLKLHPRSLDAFSLMTPRLERVSKQNQGFSFPIHQKASLMHFFICFSRYHNIYSVKIFFLNVIFCHPLTTRTNVSSIQHQ